jgi:predicted GNAT family N-acyltransferase
MLHFLLVSHGSDLYVACVSLRHDVLRAPLGLSFSASELAAESDSQHVAVSDSGGDLLACLILKPLSSSLVKMRQVAVRSDKQGQGVGRFLLEQSEVLAREQGYTQIEAHVRQTALGFYAQAGYTVVSELFEEVGIPHVKMEKKL